jgi:hypothetical protein
MVVIVESMMISSPRSVAYLQSQFVWNGSEFGKTVEHFFLVTGKFRGAAGSRSGQRTWILEQAGGNGSINEVAVHTTLPRQSQCAFSTMLKDQSVGESRAASIHEQLLLQPRRSS